MYMASFQPGDKSIKIIVFYFILNKHETEKDVGEKYFRVKIKSI
jgi:hypothetical protein